jgi:choline-glycine betaine transporter
MLEALRTLMIAALFAFVAQPVAASGSDAVDLAVTTAAARQDELPYRETSYQWNSAGTALPATQLMPDEPTGRGQTIVQIALGLLMIVLVACGFTIAITSLRADIRQRRDVYHRRVRI